MSYFDRLLTATIEQLHDQKAAGIRTVEVDAASLAVLVHRGRPAVTATPIEVAPAETNIASIEAAASEEAKAAEVTGADRDALLAGLRARALACVKCPNLVATRKTVVFGVGDPAAQLMFVGEAPGADEDAKGEPFIGAAGQLLTRIIQTMGLTRGKVYIANVLKCRPDMPEGSFGNRKPTVEEMRTCLPYLEAQIDLIKPRVIVALGATAVQGLQGGTPAITRLRGQWQEFRGIPLMPTFHPSYLLRLEGITEKRKVWEDMLQVMERLGMTVTEKHRGYFLKA